MPYLNTQEVTTKLEILSLQYPTMCQRITLPFTTSEGRISHAIRIRAGARPYRPAVLLIGCVHAREWGSADILVALAETLLVAYQANSGASFLSKTYTANEIRDMMETVDLIIFPVVNPDGRTYSQTVDAWWRKNRAPTSQTGVLGTDVNRNFDFLWDFRRHFAPGLFPASDDPTWGTFHGSSPESEAETKNVKHIANTYPNIRFFVDVHSYSELILYPWGDDANQSTDPNQHFLNVAFDGARGHVSDTAYREFIVPEEAARHQNIAQRMNGALQQARGRSYFIGPIASSLYIVSGASTDYMCGRHLSQPNLRKIDSFLIEWGKQFQPPYSEMENIIQEVSAALIELCRAASDTPLIDKTPNPLNFGLVRIGTGKLLLLTVRNVGVGSIELTSIQAQGAGFSTTIGSVASIPEGGSAVIPVSFAPTPNGPVTGRLSFQFKRSGGVLVDVDSVALMGAKCSVSNQDCVAPVFGGSGWLGCLLLASVLWPVIALMSLFIWIPGVRCAVLQLWFRIRNCREGNTHPCRHL